MGEVEAAGGARVVEVEAVETEARRRRGRNVESSPRISGVLFFF